MQNKIFRVAGCAALILGLAACSGEDGVNGVNGLNGSSCEVKSLKTGDGYKVLCGGDSVGVLLNGKTGTTGKAGESCSVKELSSKDGYDVICGGKTVGKLKNGAKGNDGASCTTSSADDGIVITCGSTTTKITNGKSCTGTKVTKDGKKGIEMACGGTVIDTLWDGSGTSTSSDCTTEDNNNGTYTVKCGDADPITMYKAMCGISAYDPADKFCVLGKLYDKCGTKKETYKVNTEFCENGKVVPACFAVRALKVGDADYDADHPSVKILGVRAPTDDEFCWNGFIMPKCNDSTYDNHHFCGKAFNKMTDSILEYCANPSVIDDLIRVWVTYKKEQEKVEPDEDAQPSSFGDLIGESIWDLNDATLLTQIKAIYQGLKAGKLDGTQFCSVDYTKKYNKCGSKAFEPDTQFCDRRDNHLYNMVTLNVSATTKLRWMTENLAYEYKLPRVNNGVVSISDKVNFVYTAYQNYTSSITAAGRYYSWNAAVGKDDARTTLDDDGNVMFNANGFIKVKTAALPAEYSVANLDELESHKTVPGACPDGWRLPTKEELKYVVERDGLVKKLNLVESGYYNITFDEVAAPTTADPTATTIVMNKKLEHAGNDSEIPYAYLWTVNTTETDGVYTNATTDDYGLVFKTYTDLSIPSIDKNMALPIRCVQQVPAN